MLKKKIPNLYGDCKVDFPAILILKRSINQYFTATTWKWKTKSKSTQGDSLG
jgi:hypothetical protein